MQVRMPAMDGLEATRRICAPAAVPIIAPSANAFDEDAKKAMASGMNGHLSKPIEANQLLRLLARYMT